MQNHWVRDATAALCALVLLALGGALLMVGLYALGLSMNAFKAPGEAQLILTIYYKVVVVKGLLPQLALALLIWSASKQLRATGNERIGKLRLFLELLGASALAFCVVAPLLLSVEFEQWPALSMPSWGSRIGNLVMMSGAVAVAAWIPQALLSSKAAASSESGQPQS